MGTEDKVRILIIGMGAMGNVHADNCTSLSTIAITGFCDSKRSALDRALTKHPEIPVFENYREAMDKTHPDAVLIATPHFSHPDSAMEAFERGIHVLTEKPVAAHAKDARRMVKAWEGSRGRFPNLLFAAMFQQRTLGQWRKIKSIIDGGELGKLVRTTWIITDWFRTQAYYNSGSWRATWSGEGGGVLLNQCPHNLDLYCWFVGLPQSVRGFCGIGKYHDIEVEDEVTAYLEHSNGMIGHFITSTGEAPGTNRLEIVGENGVLLFDNGILRYRRNRRSMLLHLKHAPDNFSTPECSDIVLPFEANTDHGHRAVVENFAQAIKSGTPLVAPALEGINGLSLGNAILFSSLEGKTIGLPMDEDAYADRIAELASKSRFLKNCYPVMGAPGNLTNSF